MDDDEWVERLRRAVVEGGTAVQERAEPPSAQPEATPGSEPAPEQPELDVAGLTSTITHLDQAVRQLDEKVSQVNARLRLLEHQRERIVDQIADAVVARLDARPQPAPESGWRGTASRWLSG